MSRKNTNLSVLAMLLPGLALFVKPGITFAAPNKHIAKQATSASEIKPDISPFFLFLKQQAQKNGTVYLVEGEPALVPVSEKAEADTKPPTSLQEWATAYGYRAEALPSGIVVFHKTYYDERDLPSVTLAEWQAAVKDMKAIINAASPHVTMPPGKTDSMAQGIMDTFTPAQLAAMRRGQAEVEQRQSGKAPTVTDTMRRDNGVSVSALSPSQKAAVWQAARFIYVQNSLVDAERGFIQSETVLAGNPVFKFHDMNGVRLFGYEIKSPGGKEARFVSLSNPYQFMSSPDGIRPLRGRDKDTFLVPVQNDPTVPSTKNTQSILPLAIPLKDLVRRLNIQDTTTSAKPITVDDELGAKRITVAGNLAKANPLNVVRAVASVYGLRVVNSANQIVLTRPRVRTTDDPARVGDALEEVMPLPFLNAYHRIIRKDDPVVQGITLSKGMQVTSEKVSAGLRWASIRRIRETISQKIEKSATKEVSLADFDDVEKEAFATILMSYGLKSLVGFAATPAPAFITDFDTTIVIGSVELGRKGEPWLTVFLGQRVSDGSLVQESGFSSRIHPQ